MALPSLDTLNRRCATRAPCAVLCVGCIVAVFVLLPLLVLLACSVNASRVLEWPKAGVTARWYGALLADAAWQRGFITSLILASIVAFLSTAIGSGIAARATGWQPLLRAVGTSFFRSPVAIPVISFALALYICLVRLHLADTLLGLIGAHCVLCTPVTFGLAAASLARRAPFLEEAALNLGASRTQTWLLVTLPSIRNAILASLLLSFAVSFNEVVAVVFLSDVEVITVSKRLWDGIRFEISPILAAASVLTLAVAVPAVISFDILASRALLSARKDE